MEPSAFDELAFFRAVHESGARALLIGRRALVLLGLPVLTADYDFWIAVDDIAIFNAACARFGLVPTRTSDDARRAGRYVLENDEHVDVLVARSVPTVDGRAVAFDELWGQRQSLELASGVFAAVPSIEHLILTKQVSSRPKDLEDIRHRGNVTERLRQLTERQVTAPEVREALDRPLDDREREEVLALVRWFRRRYPTGVERLAYVRRAYHRWTAARRVL